MDVFLYQVLNNCKITIGYTEEPSDDDMVETLQPSHSYGYQEELHQLEPDVSRVTFSFGVEGDTDPATYV